ncbi:MAG: site-specific DNA-methyltransferase [Pseudomonadota bacterium]|nr:site-specific DNA-methyltransferase [Pseudomonadota bacterium]
MSYELLIGDCRESLRTLPAGSVNCCVTSPPYFNLRDYGHEGQIGLEQTPSEFVESLVRVFREVRPALRDDGTLWLNLGDSYGKGKQLLGMPWRVAFALQDDGWTLRQEIVWNKPNCMPSSVTDRCVSSHEHLFLLAKNQRYYFDHKAIQEDAVSSHPSGNGFKRPARLSYRNADGTARGNDQQWKGVGGKRNRRDVWTVPVRPYKGAHFATFPPDLIEPCILAGCPEGGTVLDPFGGSGTTAGVALANKRRAILCELNPEYADLIDDRVRSIVGEPEEEQIDLFEGAFA